MGYKNNKHLMQSSAKFFLPSLGPICYDDSINRIMDYEIINTKKTI